MRLKKEMKSILSDRKTAHQNGLKPSGHERTCLDERVICAPEFLHATKNEASSNCPLSDKNLFVIVSTEINIHLDVVRSLSQDRWRSHQKSGFARKIRTIVTQSTKVFRTTNY